MTLLVLLLSLSTLYRSRAAAPPILSTSLTSQLVPSNPAISSAFLVPPTSALLINASSPFPALRVPPRWSFSLGFSGGTFLPPPGSSQKLSFSSRLDNGRPLPDWLVFSRETITFGGVTPKENNRIQVLKIVVTASANSNITTSDSFTLIVSPHDLSVTGPLLARNITVNNSFSVVLDDWTGVQVDGAPPNRSTLIPTVDGELDPDGISSSDSANLSLSLDVSSFPWLKYDVSSSTLSGSPPQSLAGTTLPIIPASVKLGLTQSGQFLSAPTNLTLVIVPSFFSASNLPVLSAPSGTKIAFALTSFLTSRGSLPSSNHRRAEMSQNLSSNVNVSATWNPQNATWLTFDNITLVLSGTVPQNAPQKIEVMFMAQDETKGTVSRTQMRIDVAQGGGDGILPKDTLRRKIKLAIGVVFGVAAAVILLAYFLVMCRQCFMARKHVEGAYVIDQSAREPPAPYRSSLEKQDLTSPEVSAIASEDLGPPLAPVNPRVGNTMNKAAFFDAMLTRFGSDGSWRNPSRARSTSGSGSRPTKGSDHTGIAFFGSSKRPLKNQISRPVVTLSSTTSVRDGFAERRLDKSGSHPNGKRKGGVTTNFTIFGDGNHAWTGDSDEHDGGTPGGAIRISPGNSDGKPKGAPAHRDVSHAIGRMFMSSPGSHSNTDRSLHGSVGTGSPGKSGSGSEGGPSLGTGTLSGTQSTFATGESTRLTNAAGEVPFRRPGFDGRWESLAERNKREARRPLAEGSTDHIGAERSIGRSLADRSPGSLFPPRELVKGTGNLWPPSSARMAASKSNVPLSSNSTPAESAISIPYKSPTMATSNTPPMSSITSRSVRAKNASNTSSLSPEANGLAKLSTPPQTGVLTRTVSRIKFFSPMGSESDSHIEVVNNAVIAHGVNNSFTVSPVITGATQRAIKLGKPRLVPFTHKRTAAASGGPRRDISQKAVLQGTEDSDPEAEMRMGFEYVRQLGDPDSNYATSHPATKTMPSATVSFAPNTVGTPSAECYVSNQSNNSIAGRSRVLAPLLITSHRGRYTPPSLASTHDSFLSLAERERHSLVESSLPRFTFGVKEPFNFGVPLDREHKYASALAGSALEAEQADGRPLPEWLRFDKGGKEFWGVTPSAAHGENGELLVTRVVVKIWDGEKDEVVGGCIIDVFGERA
ncbi:hypothetical protein JB92DRAFT_2958450 [Gautieria morchelliformis]|nr:hypothetical protein JB92DRAFT_2958450 [Gautieria morchelliformis]